MRRLVTGTACVNFVWAIRYNSSPGTREVPKICTNTTLVHIVSRYARPCTVPVRSGTVTGECLGTSALFLVKAYCIFRFVSSVEAVLLGCSLPAIRIRPVPLA